MSTIAVDFDGVIHDQNPPKGKRMGAPIDGAADTLRRWVAQGHEVIVHTARTEHEHVKNWLRYFNLPPLTIMSLKPNADVYLDDRAIRFHDWDRAREDVAACL